MSASGGAAGSNGSSNGSNGSGPWPYPRSEG
jgi:hypothetical protein